MVKLFGTDGVRGLANSVLTPETAFALGRAGAFVLTKESASPRVIIGTDTRVSCGMLKAALAAGLCSAGADVFSAGVITTPAVAGLTRKQGFDAGVMISASHNPFYDNGIKFFDRNGFKLSDELENEIEALISKGLEGVPRAEGEKIGRIMEYETALDDYLALIKPALGDLSLSGLKIALDCSNGAAYEAAPLLFYELGASVFVINNEPDGTNINRACGSTQPAGLAEFVKETGADVGFAFDGDCDRIIAADENGNIVDGDMMLLILAKRLKSEGRLVRDTVVGTVMSNLGFLNGCRENGITAEITKVGDRYVLEKMMEKGYNLGGEDSGHIIFLDYGTTGDGILAAAQIAKIMKSSGKRLSELNALKKFPQVLVNARVPHDKKDDYLTNPKIRAGIRALEDKYASAGRVLIRPSGTEPLVRVMIEGGDLEAITGDARELAGYIEELYQRSYI